MPYKVTTWPVIFSLVRPPDKTPARLRSFSFKRLPLWLSTWQLSFLVFNLPNLSTLQCYLLLLAYNLCFLLLSPDQKDSQVDVSLQTRTCVRTCDGWSNKFASRLVSSRKLQKVALTYLRTNLSSIEVNASGWPNETQVERESKTCVDLRVRLARALIYNTTFDIVLSYYHCTKPDLFFIWIDCVFVLVSV